MQNKKLEKYYSKRDFSKTPEPQNFTIGAEGIFVVQKHQASTLHYDFRLEIGGVLKSWAVPKGPSTDPKDKRLAIETEDHPMSYVDFSGVIPEGNYGAGIVEIWDKGGFKNAKEESLDKSYREGRLEVILSGNKLKGIFNLIKTNKGWLLFKSSKDLP